MVISSMSIGRPARDRRTHRPRQEQRARRCWCCSTASKVRRPATTRRPLPHARTRNGWRLRRAALSRLLGRAEPGPRAYHSGDFEEIGWILERLRAQHAGPIDGGGRLARRQCVAALGRRGGRQRGADGRARSARCRRRSTWRPAARRSAAASTGRSTPACSCARMKPKALRKLAQHPGLFDRERLLAARDLYEFDNVFTAPLARLSRDTDDYWSRGSAKPHLHRIRIPALVLNARNDPFVPARSLPQAARGGRVCHAVAAGTRRARGVSRRALARATCSPCPSRCWAGWRKRL